MTNCDRLSERMPEVAHGRASWGFDDERHLADCEACRAEWELVRRVVRLGDAAGIGIDEANVTDAVLRRLRVAPGAGPRRQIWIATGLAAAASIVLLIWGSTGTGEGRRQPAPAARESTPVETAFFELPIPELDDFEVEELTAALDSLDRPFDEIVEASEWEGVEGRGFSIGAGQ